MMLDWFVLLTPLILLPIVILFVFVGCAQILDIDEVQYSNGPGLKLNYFDVPSNIVMSLQVTWILRASAGTAIGLPIVEPANLGAAVQGKYADGSVVIDPANSKLTAVLALGTPAQVECNVAINAGHTQPHGTFPQTQTYARINTMLVWNLRKNPQGVDGFTFG